MPDNLRAIPPGPKLPQELYEASQVAAFDRLTIEEFGIPGLELMERAGAYGFAMSSQYNMRGKPRVVLVRDSTASLIREAETTDDLLRLERIPSRLMI